MSRNIDIGVVAGKTIFRNNLQNISYMPGWVVSVTDQPNALILISIYIC
jgi:hypothetical protein